MRRRDFVISAGAAMTAVGALSSSLGAALAQESPETATPEPQTEPTDAAPPKPFGFEDVAAMAKDLASKPYEYRDAELIGTFANLTYDQYRGIRFRRDRDPWVGSRDFALDLLPPGSIFHEPVDISLVDNGVVIPVKFDPHMFDFDPAQFPDGVDYETLGDMGWSGFRIRTPLNRPDVMDEVAVFQGASYFRAVARGTLYGLSARGLAIGTGSPEGEEFPLFRGYWIHKPGDQDRSVLIHALLDSKSVSGAFEFRITPGAETVFDTRVSLFPRSDMRNIGIAPLTSMYWFGPTDRSRVDDYRPAVHDSDGLQMLTGDEQRLWRVLSGHSTLQTSAFMDNNPLGFGLAQRARDFESYKDAEARYERRPSGWIAPQDGWGKGTVNLIEIPVENEFNDNIVSFWQPADTLVTGNRYDFNYILSFASEVPDSAPISRVVETMSGKAINDPNARTYIVDFDLGLFGAEDPVPAVRASAGRIGHSYLLRLPEQRRMRLAFEYVPEGAKLADLSAVLNGPEGPLSETWIARWTRE
ncbi:glucan biosynthesis protein [Paracoccus aminovorans]|uniref:glucan biosynthesis protein n=1 Tax=Paracoccus aminovorans TaxID=34004 RepID=UPI0007859FCB|nr:glucan biosynthesis protein G [Paracoccus aminovorans]MDQ7774846.1 glucan biosynthesis protein G [Paracoccus aminovorans]MDQ7777797.1 glucan biosynthesis protein G [Paracoccus aminovorans]